MITGSSDTRPFGKLFQIRWAEKLGVQGQPYLIRWTLILFGYSIRLHHWLRSDDRRFFHDHSADLLSIVLKGDYYNVKPIDRKYPPSIATNEVDKRTGRVKYKQNLTKFHVFGLFNSWKNFLNMKDSIWFSKATDLHYLEIPRGGAWTLLFEGKQYNKWGFYVPRMDKNHKYHSMKVQKMRPYRYFKKFGIAQTEGYQ